MIGFGSGARFVFSTKADGSMKRADGSIDKERIEKFLTRQKISGHVVSMHQIHSGNVVKVATRDLDIVESTDGLVTNLKGINLSVLTADCLPIAFYDPHQKAIGIAHAGHRGLSTGILHNVIACMVKEYSSNPRDIEVIIGAGIEEKCYEVGAEFVDRFEKDTGVQPFYSQTNGKYCFSLQKIAIQYLLKEGILKEKIQVINDCTKCSTSMLYSYRNGDIAGRFVSIINLV